jgi:tetratricopeptide (TPR) repeat protein
MAHGYLRGSGLATLAVLIWIAVPVRAPAQAAPQGETTSPANQAPASQVPPPAANATLEELEDRGDDLRGKKLYLDAEDYYTEALERIPSKVAAIYNKIGIANLQLGRHDQARKNFERALKEDKSFAEAHNNLGVIYYMQKKYGNAVKAYRKALEFRELSASFHSNLANAYFSQKEFDKAATEYQRALELDSGIFERSSTAGVSAQMSSPEDRAAYSFVLARMYAKSGDLERSLQYLRRAIEDGYPEVKKVYEDTEFADLRKDPRFGELMAAKPVALP